MKMPRLKRKKKTEDFRSVADGDLSQPIDLTEFMHGVGRVMKLPEKPPPTPVKAVEAVVEAPKKPRSRIVMLSVTAVALVLIVLGLSAITSHASDELPPELLGRWQALSPKYAARGLEFREGALYMKRGTEDSDLVRLAINRVRVRPKNGSRHVIIDYMENGAILSLDLTLHDEGGIPVVELRNLPDVLWRKESAGAPQAGARAFLPPAFKQ